MEDGPLPKTQRAEIATLVHEYLCSLLPELPANSIIVVVPDKAMRYGYFEVFIYFVQTKGMLTWEMHLTETKPGKCDFKSGIMNKQIGIEWPKNCAVEQLRLLSGAVNVEKDKKIAKLERKNARLKRKIAKLELSPYPGAKYMAAREDFEAKADKKE